MKETIIFLVFIIGCQTFGLAATNTDIINKLENSLFGFTYSNDTEISRLNRIEQKVYGKTSSAQTQTRIAKLKKDLSADLIGQEIEPKEDTFAEEENSYISSKDDSTSSKIDYPVINELEQQVFKKEFKDQNIKTRLSNLETKTFGKTYQNEDLSTRVDRLKAEIKPQTFMSNSMDKQENHFFMDDAGKMAQNYHLKQYGAPFGYENYNNSQALSSDQDFDIDIDNDYLSTQSNNVFRPTKPMSLASIEKTLYKTKFENETTAQRLARIETSVFGTNFANDSDEARISRISSALKAQKSARQYDSNRFGQNMATAFQIGTLILMVLACIL